jgi:hypothetical protein
MERYKGRVVMGTLDKYLEQGLRWLDRITYAILILAALWFGPVVFNIFWR